jgi:hypothetical protein
MGQGSTAAARNPIAVIGGAVVTGLLVGMIPANVGGRTGGAGCGHTNGGDPVC